MKPIKEILGEIAELEGYVKGNISGMEDRYGYYLEYFNDIQELIDNYSNRDKEFIDQLHYAHEHLYACQSDFYSNGGHLNSYHIEKLETAKAIIDNTLNYIREREKNNEKYNKKNF